MPHQIFYNSAIYWFTPNSLFFKQIKLKLKSRTASLSLSLSLSPPPLFHRHQHNHTHRHKHISFLIKFSLWIISPLSLFLKRPNSLLLTLFVLSSSSIVEPQTIDQVSMVAIQLPRATFEMTPSLSRFLPTSLNLEKAETHKFHYHH